MKKIFTAPNVIPCDSLKAILAAKGIPSSIKNERGSMIAEIGYPAFSCSTLPFEWPEVWVQDEDLQRAGEIVMDCQNDKSRPNVLRSFHRSVRRINVVNNKQDSTSAEEIFHLGFVRKLLDVLALPVEVEQGTCERAIPSSSFALSHGR